MWDFGTVKTMRNQNIPATMAPGTFTRRQGTAAADANRFDTGASGGSSGSSNGGTVRQAGLVRPGLESIGAGAMPAASSPLASRQDPSVHNLAGSGFVPVEARDYGNKFDPQTSAGPGPSHHGRYASAAERYDAAANGISADVPHRRYASQDSEDDEMERRLRLEEERQRLEELSLGGVSAGKAATRPANIPPRVGSRGRGHGKQRSADSDGSIDPVTAANLGVAHNGQEPAGTSAQPEQLTALDTVLLPVLEQVSQAWDPVCL